MEPLGLRKVGGHIGYGIAPQYRGKGYGKELLRLDVCVAMPRFKPDWLGWHTAENYGRVTTFWRNGETVQKYLPDFAFTNWRDVHKHYAVEEFDVDPWSLEKGCAFLLVDYAKKRLTRIEPDDII